jgi:serine phosphatase RsbU (regulator of sigma subunit)/CheY-like chemotaxis protein
MTGPATVLVVDDTAAHRYVMSSWLRRAGYAVVEAAGGGDALALAGSHLDAVVLDVNLPDISGTEVCDRLKADRETALVPVLHVSATSIDARSRTTGLEHGADAYLVEPLDRGEFLATVGMLCRRREEQRGAGRTTRRLQRLAAALVPLHEARTYDGVVEAAAEGACEVLGQPVIAMVAVGPGHVLRALCASDGGPTVRGHGTGPVVVDHERPTVVRSDELSDDWRELVERAGLGPHDWCTTVLVDADQNVVGGLAVAQRPGVTAQVQEDADAMRRFTDAMSVALANVRSFAEEHRIALALQSAMLPSSLPDDARLELAARYLAADGMLAVGGDFYDAFVLPDGRTALVVGDVQGHSLRAAIVMGELRTMLRAYLFEGHPPDRAIELLDRALRASHPEFVTACVCVVDRTTGTVEMLNAGHLPPLVVGADGTTRPLTGGTRLLGLATETPRRSRVEELGPGDTLVIVTDGLIERRGVTLRDALDALADVCAAHAHAGPPELADVLLRAFDAGREDDVAVLAARWNGPDVSR